MNAREILRNLLAIPYKLKPEEAIAFTDEPKLPTYVTVPNEAVENHFECVNIKDVENIGTSLWEITAKIKSLAEFYERLCIFEPEENRFVTNKYLGEPYVDPSLFLYFSNEQLKGRREEVVDNLRRGTYKWVKGKNVLDDKEIYLPGQVVFLSDRFKDELPICEQITTGAAFGLKGSNFAFEHGLLEVVERDAFMTSYLTKKKLPEIINVDGQTEELIEYLNRYRLEPRIFDATTDLEVPVIISLILDRTGIGPAVTIGGRADFTYRKAILDSLLEAIQFRLGIRTHRELNLGKRYAPKTEIPAPLLRANYWYPRERIKDLNFWLDSPPQIQFDKLKRRKSSLENALSKLNRVGYHVFVVDLTLPELNSAGFEVVKVVVPELHRLYLDENYKALYSVHAGEIKEDKSLKPHPFP